MSNVSDWIDMLSPEKRELLELMLEDQTDGDYVALSFAQERLWFLQQLDPQNPQYNLPMAVRLSGRLDAELLAESLNTVIERHEILRTSFVLRGGQPVQRIAPVLRLNLALVDLCDQPQTLREQAAWELARAEAARPFDLARGPLLRAALLRLAEDQHLLLLTIHHIAVDGWSLGLLVRELAELYRAGLTGATPALPELAIQYADFAQWQREQLEGPELAAQIDYWRERLAGAPTLLELPADFPRPSVQSMRGSIHTFEIAPELAEQIQALCRQEEVTPFMLLLAAFQTLLFRYTGQTDLLLGTPIAGRTLQELEPLIGCFVNTLVLRAEPSSDLPFRELLRQVRRGALEAFDRQEVPFERLVELLQPERTLSHTPLVQVMFSFQPAAPLSSLSLPNLRLEMLELDSSTAKFDLSLSITGGRELRAVIEYCTDLFDAATVERMAGHFQTLLAGAVADPAAPLAALPLLTGAEQDWLAAAARGPLLELPAGTVLDAFEAQAARLPDAPAVCADGNCLTYAALDRQANQLAHHLRRLGVGPAQPVALLLPRSTDFVLAQLAVLKAGGAYVPLDPSAPAERLAWMLQDCGALVLLAHDTPVPFAGLRLDLRDPATWAGEPCEAPAREADLDQLAYVIYTSGSTGTPKGVAVEHGGLRSLATWQVAEGQLRAGDRLTQVAGPAFDATVLEVWPALTSGACLLVGPEAVRLDAAALRDWLLAERVTVSFVPTPLAEGLLAQEWPEDAALRLVWTGGDALRRRPGAGVPFRLLNQYGPTETTVVATAGEVGPEGGIPAIGRPIPNTTAYVLDGAMQPVPVGVPGELYVGGIGVARGYLGRPELTAERFVPNPFGESLETEGLRLGASEPLQASSLKPQAPRLYRTGDRVRWQADGQLEFLGRLDGQVKLRGYRLELGEVEAALQQHPAVRQAVVVARHDAPGGAQLVAYLVLAEELTTAVATLKTHLQERLPEYMVPSALVILDALPLTPNGKLDRKALPAPEYSAATSEYVAPRNPAEQLIADIWGELLGIERVGAHDNFFELGGHSLLATQVLARVRERLGADLPVRALFEAPVVADLAVRVQQARTQRTLPPILPVDRSTDLPLSFAQDRLWFLHQMDPASAVYHLSFGTRLEGALDHGALERSLNELVRRHEILRTTFPTAAGHPVQQIAASQTVELDLIDLGFWPDDQREAEARRIAAEEALRPFDLVHGPLLRSLVLRLAGDQHILLLTLHHVVADGWSVTLLIRELGALYSAFQAGEHPALPVPAVQYADYAAWQRAFLQGEELERQIAYWRANLVGLEDLNLPADRPRPPVQTFRGATVPFRLPAELSRQLAELNRREGVTMFMTLLAAFQTLLGRYSSQEVFGVGSPIAGRNHPATESIVGAFINMLVLRSDLSGDPTFRELLRRVRETTLDAYAHQDLPFEKLVEELVHDRDLSRSPLFQVMLIMQNAPQAELRLAGLHAEPLELEGATAKYELTLAVQETEQGLAGAIEYNADLFDAATVARMAAQLATLLAGVVVQPDARLSDLPLLPEAELRRLLVEWNDTTLPYEVATVHELIAAQVARTPDQTALVFGGRSLSYRELDARANQLAQHLRGLGVRPGALVGICLERSLEMLVAILGTLKAGGAYLPLDPDYPAERIQLMLEDAQPLAVLTDSPRRAAELGQSAGTGAVWVDLKGGWAAIAGLPEQAPDNAASPDDLAYVIYTSGSTGRPKGVTIAHRNVANFFAGMDRTIGGDTPGTWLAVTSISFDISVLELLWTLARGFKVVIQPERSRAYGGGAPAVPQIDRPIDFSLFYFASDEEGRHGVEKYRLLLEGARFADRHGFSAVWTPERHFHAFGGLYPNPAVIGAALATATEHIQIRAGSVVLPLQQPIRVAEEWSVVDNLSNGRVGLSFASGWHANDFVLAPDNFQDRKQIMLRDIEVVRQLWRGEAVTMRSGAGKPVEVRTLPRPVQPELPFWVTAGGSPDTFRNAGEIGANLLTHLLGQSLEELAEKIAIYRRAWREQGHPGEGHVSLMLHTYVGEDPEEVRRLVRRPFGQYLKSSLDLWKNLARSLGHDIDAQQFTAEEEDALISHAFDRYAQSSGLIGTPEQCLAMVNRLKAIGVDEVACLVDFGVDTSAVLGSLDLLDQVRVRSNQPPAEASEPLVDSTISAQILRHGVTHLQGTPSLMRMLLGEPEAPAALAALRQIMLGGEALPAALVEDMRLLTQAAIFNMYGPTETTIWSAVQRVEGGDITIGRPIANTQLYILDQQRRPQPIGVPGELYIGGDGVVPGYLRRPELTAERFVEVRLEARDLRLGGEDTAQASSLKPQASRLYRTGDLARWRADGQVEFLGRIDSQVKLRGYRIELGEIEAALAEHAAVREAVVVAREDTPGEPYLAAYVVPSCGRVGALRPRLSPAEQARLLAGHKQYRLPNGMVMAHLSDLQVHAGYQEVIENQIYLRHGVTLNDGDCVVDVGANIGFFSLFANLQRRNVRIYAFEPIPTTYNVLRANIELYGLDVHAFPIGLSGTNETAEFTFYPEMAGLSGRYSTSEADRAATRAMILQSLRDHPETAASVYGDSDLDAILERQFRSERHQCQLRPLSDIIREQGIERIDLLKIDVEKAEYDVLEGIEQADWPKIRQLALEIDTRENLERITALLEHKGFRVAVEDFSVVEARDGEAEMYVYMMYAVRPSDQAEQPPAPEELTSAGLRGLLQQRLPDYMIPSVLMILDSLPLTPNGKIDRKALPAPTGARAASETTFVPPQNDLERTIAEVWQSLLRVEKVGVNDNFFELGGSSLLIAQARTQLREALGSDVSLVDLFRFPTVRALAAHLAQAEPATATLDKARARAERQVARRQGRTARRGANND